jgi:hypothetical protein
VARFKPSHDEIHAAVTRLNIVGLTHVISKAHHAAHNVHEHVRTIYYCSICPCLRRVNTAATAADR